EDYRKDFKRRLKYFECVILLLQHGARITLDASFRSPLDYGNANSLIFPPHLVDKQRTIKPTHYFNSLKEDECIYIALAFWSANKTHKEGLESQRRGNS